MNGDTTRYVAHVHKDDKESGEIFKLGIKEIAQTAPYHGPTFRVVMNGYDVKNCEPMKYYELCKAEIATIWGHWNTFAWTQDPARLFSDNEMVDTLTRIGDMEQDLQMLRLAFEDSYGFRPIFRMINNEYLCASIPARFNPVEKPGYTCVTIDAEYQGIKLTASRPFTDAELEARKKEA